VSKQLHLSDKTGEYTLEFSRRSIEQMERGGFVAAHIVEKPMTVLPTLFAGTFLKNHRKVKREVIDDIFSRLKNKQELISRLAEMYNEPIEALLDEPEEDEGNATWEASW